MDRRLRFVSAKTRVWPSLTSTVQITREMKRYMRRVTLDTVSQSVSASLYREIIGRRRRKWNNMFSVITTEPVRTAYLSRSSQTIVGECGQQKKCENFLKHVLWHWFAFRRANFHSQLNRLLNDIKWRKKKLIFQMWQLPVGPDGFRALWIKMKFSLIWCSVNFYWPLLLKWDSTNFLSPFSATFFFSHESKITV